MNKNTQLVNVFVFVCKTCVCVSIFVSVFLQPPHFPGFKETSPKFYISTALWIIHNFPHPLLRIMISVREQWIINVLVLNNTHNLTGFVVVVFVFFFPRSLSLYLQSSRTLLFSWIFPLSQINIKLFKYDFERERKTKINYN